MNLLRLITHSDNIHVKSAAFCQLKHLVSNISIHQKKKLSDLLVFEEGFRTVLAKRQIANVMNLPLPLMGSLYSLYFLTLVFLYLGILYGSIKFADLQFNKSETDEILKQMQELGVNDGSETDETVTENMVCISKLLRKLTTDRLSKWNSRAKGSPAIGHQKFCFDKCQRVVVKLIGFCDPSLPLGTATYDDSVIKDISDFESWLEKYIFLRYLSIQVCILSCTVILFYIYFADSLKHKNI